MYMTCIFDTTVCRRIHSANRTLYQQPCYHPSRLLTRHDIFYIIEGGFKIGLGDDIIDGKKDGVVILPANVWHIGLEECAPGTQTLWILMESEENDATLLSSPEKTQTTIPLPPYIDASGNPDIWNYFKKILLSYVDGDENRSSAYMTLLLCDLYDISHKPEQHMILADEIRHIINMNLYRNITNKEIAQKLGRSTKNVETIFKSHFGITIHQYLIQEKLQKSKLYLEYFPNRTIYDIAAELSFYDEYHFSRQFKKFFGISPTEHRKKFLSEQHVNFVTKKE